MIDQGNDRDCSCNTEEDLDDTRDHFRNIIYGKVSLTNLILCLHTIIDSWLIISRSKSMGKKQETYRESNNKKKKCMEKSEIHTGK